MSSEQGISALSSIMQDKRHFKSVLSSGSRSSTYPTAAAAYPTSLAMNAMYFDGEVSNMSMGAASGGNSLLSYSADTYLPGHAFGESPARLAKVDSKLAFSSPKAGTDASSGANSNRSVLDNEEAAEVLSVMNSPNNYMKPFNPEEVFGRYRDTVTSSLGSGSAQSTSLSNPVGGGMYSGRGLLLSDINDEGDGASEGKGGDGLGLLRGEQIWNAL